jgi:hypothetical protein
MCHLTKFLYNYVREIHYLNSLDMQVVYITTTKYKNFKKINLIHICPF